MRYSILLASCCSLILAACASGDAPPSAPPVRPAPTHARAADAAAPNGPVGYYRQPALGEGVLVFVAEGDLWKVAPVGGVATRLTSHPGDESRPAISPDGAWVAFIGQYEGPTEVYVMPLAGGLPERLTWDNAGARAVSVVGWTPDGRIMATTDRFSTLPSTQLTLIDHRTRGRELVPLEQASDGAFDPSARSTDDATLVFTRLPFNGSWTKRYKGGTIQHLWSFKEGDAEAKPLTSDFAGTSKRAMWWDGRVCFLTDRDGHMNVWSMTPAGADLRQHTRHSGFDIMDASLHGGKIVYQLGADLWALDLATGRTAALPITLDTDLDQTRERWVEKPMEYLTSAHISPDGEKIVLTARGRIFVAPAKQGRLVDVARDDGARHRDARFIGAADSIVSLSDKSGEVEVWRHPANGVGASEQLTQGSAVLKWSAVPSPDGRLIAQPNKDFELWVHDTQKRTNTRIDVSEIDDLTRPTWSPDSRWLAYVAQAGNMFPTIRIWDSATGEVRTVTTDRYASYSPAWSPDGKWLYFLSDRTLRTLVGSPWGANQPDPYLTDTTKIYALALQPGQRWPFAPADEVHAASEKAEKQKKHEDAGEKKPDAPEGKDGSGGKDADKPAAPVEIELDGLAARLYEVPLKAGNYEDLSVNDKALFWDESPATFDRKRSLQAMEIKNDSPEPKTVVSDISLYELSQNGKSILVRKKDTLYVIDASPAPANDLDKKAVNLSSWSLSLTPRDQWRQMFLESWRLMRDYFYDTGMHGVDWQAMLDKHLPLVDRVTTRAELSDLMAQMVAELSALHTFVRGGDLREGVDKVQVAALGAQLERDDAAGGWRIERIYRCEADDPGRVAPLAKPDVGAKEGDIVVMIDGVPTLSVADIAMLLRKKAGSQTLVRIKPADGGAERDAIVVPITQESESDLRYTDWELTRRERVEELGEGRIGYVHLRAMGGGNYTEWVKGYYPVFNREGLIIDVRHNRGGNIDSWILGKLLRKPWFYWSGRVGNPPSWNMQYAFRGHVVVLCNERTASDGEAFAEGFRRLGLGKVIGTRTWGGEIWLSSSNVLVDRGIASAAETGVYAPDGAWLIEGHGVDPDIVVDNPPHATFKGEDAQLVAAVEHLKRLMREQPVPPVKAPVKPDKSSEDNRRR